MHNVLSLFPQQNMIISSIFSQQHIPDKAVCLLSLGSDPSFLQLPYSPLCSIMHNLSPHELWTEQSSVPSCSTPEMAGLAWASSPPPAGTKTRARHTPLLLKALATKQEVPLPQGACAQSKSRSRVAAS